MPSHSLFVTPDLFRGPPFGIRRRMVVREPCVYILASRPNGTLYFGVTSNLANRIVEHREGRNDSFTSRHGVRTLVCFERLDSMEAAIAREKQLKRWRRDWKRNLIERANPAWNDLAAAVVPGLQTPRCGRP